MPDARHRRWVIVLTALGSLMAALDTLVVATAIPTIRTDLGATLPQLEWTVNAYNLSLAVLLVPAAVIGDRLGRARCYAAGLGLFALASLGCALAPSADALIAMRAVQGAGAALLMTLGLALLTSAFPARTTRQAVGLYSAVTGIAVACGPLVGGLVIDGSTGSGSSGSTCRSVCSPYRSCCGSSPSPGARQHPRRPRRGAARRRLLRPGLGDGPQRHGRLGRTRGARRAGRRGGPAGGARRSGSAARRTR